jgi:mannitol-1-/sugar-/sorbitol-6-phosphatase
MRIAKNGIVREETRRLCNRLSMKIPPFVELRYDAAQGNRVYYSSVNSADRPISNEPRAKSRECKHLARILLLGQCRLVEMISIDCSAMLFDLDGVLIDSTPAVARVWHGWAVEHGFDPETVIRMAHGRPSRTTIRELLPNADIDAANREVERREIEDLEGVVVLPGVNDLLRSLPDDRWTIGTSCTRALAEVRLKAADLPIPPTLVTSNDVKIGKPDPEPYIKAAAKLGFDAHDCVVVEDAAAGVRAGKAAGARVIAFLTTMSREELEAAGADWIVENCADITASCVKGRLQLSLSSNRRASSGRA